MVNIRKLESELWEAADLLRADSKVTSQEYCMPVLGLIGPMSILWTQKVEHFLSA